MKVRKNKPIKLADSLNGINRNLINKFGKIDFVIYSKWAEIVGKFFFQYTLPEKITSLSSPSVGHGIEHQEKTLHVNVSPAAAVEFLHFQNKIIEKINSFFGYRAIHFIRINQNFTPKNTYMSKKTISKFDNILLDQKKNEIKDTTQKINDKELEQSLLNLGLSIANNEEN